MNLLGFDIGGTKCAVISAEYNNEIKIIDKKKISTDLNLSPEDLIDKLMSIADKLNKNGNYDAIGISCGGPLDSKNGIILSPPNLKGWDNVHIVEQIKSHYGLPTHLQNDANACAIAEWKFGAAKGLNNVVFRTFGTGLGAGLILDGKLYSGTNDNAGECGHIRLNDDGPVGYYKAGSFEGFCSGGGLSQLGYAMALESIKSGVYPSYYKEGMSPSDITAKSIADAANTGDEIAIKVYNTCGEDLGKGLSVLIDILNP
ncbi:MAG: ROK family protein, partial [Clostridia bacterium]|nr:ROK family protein [Clostridia bacterium]